MNMTTELQSENITHYTY